MTANEHAKRLLVGAGVVIGVVFAYLLFEWMTTIDLGPDLTSILTAVVTVSAVFVLMYVVGTIVLTIKDDSDETPVQYPEDGDDE